MEAQVIVEDRSRPIRQAWGREWANPAKRAERLKLHQAARAEAISEGVQVPGSIARRKGWPTRSKAGASLSALLWKLGRRGRLVLDAYVAKPGSPDAELGDLVGRTASWVRKLKNTGTWRMAGRGLLDMARPGARLALEQAIVTDALISLSSTDSGQAGALVKTREQAAALLGLDVKPPERVEHEHSGQLDMVHRMAEAAPREALEEFQATGNWDEAKWGAPPWRKQLGA